MARGKKAKKKKQAANGGQPAAATAIGDGLFVDPSRVRFQHSKIRPVFSGCGRSVMGTLESIRRKEISPSDLPPIQVIVGPVVDDGPWYFSLNNRRLWVLKRCREEGLLENGMIWVRVCEPKSQAEKERYSIANCAVEARIMSERPRNAKKSKDADNEGKDDSGEDHAQENGEAGMNDEKNGAGTSKMDGSTKQHRRIREEAALSGDLASNDSDNRDGCVEEKDDGAGDSEKYSDDDSDSDESDDDVGGSSFNPFSALM